ncbi:MAG TPA: DUF3866 family protein, partial [Limnochordia bacterium]|nr:DUF3866 family protein [Limnochordia bacterium]
VAGVALRRSLGAAARLVYVMTDGAALPAAMSRLLAKMRRAGWFDAVITAGHAFGGDYEAVGVPSALVAARTALGADAIVVGMGPGVVGTGTRLGTTALEQGPILDAAAALGGENLAVARVGFADARARHRGLSHHTLTALNLFAQRPAQVVLPALTDPESDAALRAQAQSLAPRHRLAWQPAAEIGPWLAESGLHITTMGRTYQQDPAFFAAAAAPALWFAARR